MGAPEPPGMQGRLFRPPAAHARAPYRVVDLVGRVVRVSHLAIAAARAARAVAVTGEAWVIVGDGSACHLTSTTGPAVPVGTDVPGGWPDTVTRYLAHLETETESTTGVNI